MADGARSCRYFHDVRVPRAWRASLLADFPALAGLDSRPMLRLVGSLLLEIGTFPDDLYPDRLVVTRDLLVWCAGRSPKHHGWTGAPLLESLAAVFPITFREHRYADHLARTVTIQAAVAKRYGRFGVSDTWVNLATGNVWTHRDDDAVRRAREQARNDFTGQFKLHPAFPVLQIMNAVPDRLFAPSTEGIAEVRRLLASLDQDSRHVDVTLRCLKRLEYGPPVAPLYRPSRSGNTARIFGGSHPALTIASRYRRLIWGRMIDVDLDSAQAGIVAKLWGIPSLMTLLQSGQSLWGILCDDLQTTDKAAIKTGFYATVFGALVDEGFLHDQAIMKDEMEEQFLAHPLIRSVIEARDASAERVRLDGYVVDAFGKRKRYRSWVPGHGPNHRMLQAWQAQSYELALMLPILDVIASRSDVQVVLWQHDGAGILIRRAKDLPAIINALAAAVAAKAQVLGIPTRLTAKG
ncbi:MAG: hypothetical protein H7338_24165 [Candidatus Sericytochromatia bacterium]|nr:hypothetical protein [Candidatus Sericytochromatia bacterium]